MSTFFFPETETLQEKRGETITIISPFLNFLICSFLFSRWYWFPLPLLSSEYRNSFSFSAFTHYPSFPPGISIHLLLNPSRTPLLTCLFYWGIASIFVPPFVSNCMFEFTWHNLPLSLSWTLYKFDRLARLFFSQGKRILAVSAVTI